jgi:hypothetical protein
MFFLQIVSVVVFVGNFRRDVLEYWTWCWSKLSNSEEKLQPGRYGEESRGDGAMNFLPWTQRRRRKFGGKFGPAVL